MVSKSSGSSMARTLSAGKGLPPATPPVLSALPASSGTGSGLTDSMLRKLPEDQLLPAEQMLRQALLDCLNEFGGKFALSAWIENRIGEEIHCVYKDNSMAISFPGASKKEIRVAKEDSFFAQLREDGFDPLELRLRDSVFEFLASWSCRELATLNHLTQYEPFVQARKAFLPNGVSAKAWVERRIGGEIHLRQEENGKLVIEVAPVAKELVRQKFLELSASKRRIFRPGDLTAGARDPRKAQNNAPPKVSETKESKAGKDPHHNQVTAFVESLPADSFLPDEEKLREAIHAVMCAHAEIEVSLPDTIADPNVKAGIAALFPAHLCPPGEATEKSVLRWINDRIGGEYRALMGKGSVRVIMKTEDYEARQNEVEALKQEFFNTLPADEFLPTETAMREALVMYMEETLKSGKQPTMSGAGSDDRVREARKNLFPPETNKKFRVSLQDWVNRRIGGEVGLATGAREPVLYFMEDGPPSAAQEGGGGAAGRARGKRRRTQ